MLVISEDRPELRAIVDRDGELVKSVNLTPFSTNPDNPNDQYWKATDASDIIFGGWGSDFLHGGVGSDAISGAEALPVEARPQDLFGNIISFDTPFNPGDTAEVNETVFAGSEAPAVHLVYLPLLELPGLLNQPRAVITFNANNEVTLEEGNNPFFLNFDHTEGQIDARSLTGLTADGEVVTTDGDDRIFGSIGHDILFGGTGQDSMYGGYGNDLINADDKLNTSGVEEGSYAGLNDLPDIEVSYEDFVYGGAGRDFMIANTAGDRLVDWTGDFNEFYVPYRSAGVPSVITSFTSQLKDYILRVATSHGADVDPQLNRDGTPISVAGEPYGELGLTNNDANNSVDLTEFARQAGPGLIPGRGTVDDGPIQSVDPIPVGPRLAASDVNNYGFTSTLGAITGEFEGDASTINPLTPAVTGADRLNADMITTFSNEVGIIVGGPEGTVTITGLDPATQAMTYTYNEKTGEFEKSEIAQSVVSSANTVLELFDADGELFAYVDEQGGVWIIDDIIDNPSGQRDREWTDVEDGRDTIEDDWLLESTVVTSGSAKVAMTATSE